MTFIEQVKVLDDKTKANKAQYDLDREATKLSALSSGELGKYEYLTGEDLENKPDVVTKSKKSVSESVKKEGILKRLKNIEGKNEK